MNLKQYRHKRDFRRTPEPEGNTSRLSGGRKFVVQRHAASHLHYDFRLEIDGSLKSWAVPKGPSLNPKIKSLAVQVEDHPLEYGDFEGLIPQDQYGGGTVMIFDSGVWEPLSDPDGGYKKGKLKFRLHGKRLKGDWVLIKSRNASKQKPQWLLIKLDDKYADPSDDHSFAAKFKKSAKSKLTMEQIAAGTNSPLKKGAKEKSDHKPRTTSAKKTAKSLSLRPQKIPGVRKGKMPEYLTPQLTTLVDNPPEGDNWLHELKFDGYRIISFKYGSKTRLMTRRRNDWSDRFPTVAEAIKSLPLKQSILDGEIVVLTAQGASNFQLLQNSIKTGNDDKHIYYVFDILYCNGYELTSSPLESRKQFLSTLLGNSNSNGTLRYSDHIRGQGAEMFSKTCGLALEGVVSKLADSVYKGRRSKSWVKSKCIKRQEFVIGGITKPQGARKHFGALLLGYYDKHGQLAYCGKVGTGFTRESLAQLRKRLDDLVIDKMPFRDFPKGLSTRGIKWVMPELVAEVEFAHWTEDSILRQPSFQGLREDKNPKEIHQEKPVALNKIKNTGPKNKTPKGNGNGGKARRKLDKIESDLIIAGVEITHPDKLIYTVPKITKIDFVRYYEQIADWILPHIINRPLAILRCPEGQEIDDKCFFQKHFALAWPDAVKKIPVQEEAGWKDYIGVDDVGGLITLSQYNVLEIHPWGSRQDRLEQPDCIIFDLDPGEGVKWVELIEAAHLVRSLFDKIDFQCFVRTTGGKGLHVVVPIARKRAWREVKQFAEAVALEAVKTNPDKYVATSTKSKRNGRIFVDYLRNDRGATAVASYSTRARPGATVATPLSWDELSNDISPQNFNIHTVVQRIRTLTNDPWEDFFDIRQSLTIARLKTFSTFHS